MSHVVNLFPILNRGQLSLAYRLVEIAKLPEGKTLYQNLQRVKRFVGKEYGTPAVLIKRDGRHYLAIGLETTKRPVPPEQDVPILQGLSAHLSVLSDPHQISTLNNLDSEDESISAAFLSFAMQSYLYNNQARLWRGSPFIYYSKEQVSDRRSQVALYPGCSFRILAAPGVGLCVALDVVHVYTDPRTLAQRIDNGEDWHALTGRHFVYEFGPQWFFIQLQEVSKLSISEASFTPKDSDQMTDVYHYTCDKWRGKETVRIRALRSEDRALVYNYPGDTIQFRGATTLARLRYQTDDPEVGRVHSLTVLNPQERLEKIQGFITNYLDRKTSVNGVMVQVSREPLQVPKRIFQIPAQLFGRGTVLPSPQQDPKAIKEMWYTRAKWLRDKGIGPLTRDGITNQFILFPLSLAEDEALLDRLEGDLTAALDEINPLPSHPIVAIWDDRGVRTALQLKHALSDAKQNMAQAGPACAIVVLPAKEPFSVKVGKMRRHIKKMLYPIRTKCIQADGALEYLAYKDDGYQVAVGREKDYRHYLFNSALDVLITSGFWPWALAEPLHYDLYVGIDVLHNTAGFTFVGAAGAVCRFQALTSEQEEKLSAEQVCAQLVVNLSELIPRIREKTGALPRHLIVHRDGRFYVDSEGEGLREGVRQLMTKGLLPADVTVGVVEIHKSQALRLRMMATLYDGRIVNPQVGSYHLIDAHRGLLCTTGYPGIPRGTVDAVAVEIVDGDLDIEKVLRDIYWLSILAWTKPDGLQRDPITIKMADDLLEPIAARTSETDELADIPDEYNSPID